MRGLVDEKDALVLRVPFRFRIIGLFMFAVLAAGIALVAALIASIGLSAWFAALPLLILVLPLWIVLPAAFGSHTSQLDADGVRARIYPRDRRRTLVPWADVTGMWIASIGRFRYLHFGLRDPRAYVNGGSTRRAVLRNLLDSHGTPVLVYIEDTRDDERLAAAVGRYSGGTVPMLDARPPRDDEPAPEPAPVPHRTHPGRSRPGTRRGRGRSRPVGGRSGRAPAGVRHHRDGRRSDPLPAPPRRARRHLPDGRRQAGRRRPAGRAPAARRSTVDHRGTCRRAAAPPRRRPVRDERRRP